MMPRLSIVIPVAAMLLLAGCGSFNILDRKVDYRSTGTVPSLEVPPDLTAPAFDERYRNDRPGSATASGLAAGAQPARSGILPVVESARIERAGTQRWLVMKGTPEATWNLVREFWVTNGFTMALERPDLGIMETDWAENKALLPQNWLRRQLGRIIDFTYDTGERDRFRTRIERGDQPDTVEVFISHRGLMEVPTKRDGMDFQWKQKEPSPELEAEMLQRLLVRVGVPEQTAQTAVARPVEITLAKIEKRDGLPMIAFDDPFDRAWRRIGLALDRVGFTVVDRDRAKGVYFVRYVDIDGSPTSRKDDGWLSKLAFWRKEDTSHLQEQYRIVVSEAGGKSQVLVQDKEGTPDKSTTAEKMLTLLTNQLK
ncbi:MAG: outer membrane protein assembly factor BamC [Betaproteobacteria bacterium]